MKTNSTTTTNSPTTGCTDEKHEEIRLVLIEDIGNRDANLDEGHVRDLAESIHIVGLLQPPVVDTELRLVSGRHRIAALRKLGRAAIPVIVRDLKGLKAQLATVDENLIRRELTALYRGELTAERKALYETLYPQTRVGGAPGRAGGGKVANDPESRSFVADTAVRTGRGRSTVAEDIRIGGILQDVREAIRNTTVADNKSELLLLAQQDEPTQKAIARELAAHRAASVKDVLRKQAAAKPVAPTAASTPMVRMLPELHEALRALRRARSTLGSVLDGWKRDIQQGETLAYPILDGALVHLDALILGIDEHFPSSPCSMRAADGRPCAPDCSACRGAGWLSRARDRELRINEQTQAQPAQTEAA